MNLFLDTSSLIKLYHIEDGTKETDEIFLKYPITKIFLSEISKLEFASAICKKVRTKEISENDATEILQLFEADYSKYLFIATNTVIFEPARYLVAKYKKLGLRTLDAIQLSTAISLIGYVDLFQTGDKLLQTFLEAEGLPTQIKL